METRHATWNKLYNSGTQLQWSYVVLESIFVVVVFNEDTTT